MLMVSVPAAVQVRSIRVAVHMAVVATVAPWIVHLAVLMVPMPVAVEMPAVGVAMHVSMVVAVAIVAIYVLRLMDDSILGRSERLRR
jgi:hypothetical protein